MDRVEKSPKGKSPYANEGEIADRDAPLLETPEGRTDDRGLSARGTDLDADVRNVPVGAVPRSEVTGRHDAGSGANETTDGLDPVEEATRASAEDIASGDGREDAPSELPTFERGLTAPRV